MKKIQWKVSFDGMDPKILEKFCAEILTTLRSESCVLGRCIVPMPKKTRLLNVGTAPFAYSNHKDQFHLRSFNRTLFISFYENNAAKILEILNKTNILHDHCISVKICTHLKKRQNTI